MFSLITTIISIALMASSLYFGINYINYEQYDKMVIESDLSSDFYNYNSAILTYKKVFNVYPATTGWENELKRLKMILPENSSNIYTYQYDTVNNTVALCHSNTVSVEEYPHYKSFHAEGLTVLNSSCYAQTDGVIDESGENISFALTMWIQD